MKDTVINKTEDEVKEELGYDDDRFYPETEPYDLDYEEGDEEYDAFPFLDDDENDDLLAEQNANYNRDIALSIERERMRWE